jgi:YjbE family integral membrane protein
MSFTDLWSLENGQAILQIFLVNLALSTDNIMLVALLAGRLPQRQRRAAIVGGGVLFIFLQTIFTLLAAYLLWLPGLMLAGGVVLFYITFKQLLDDGTAEAPEVGNASSSVAAAWMICAASLVISLDNSLAVAGASRGDPALVVVGLVPSIAVTMLCSNLMVQLLDRFQWLVFVGGAALAFTAAGMVVDSREIGGLMGPGAGGWVQGAAACGCPTIGFWMRKRRRRTLLRFESPGPVPAAPLQPSLAEAQ